jgi:hypothetical protein
MSKKWHHLMKALRQFSIAIIILGGMFYVNGIFLGNVILTIGGMLYGSYAFLLSFEKVYIEPNWELVYPELALGISEVELEEDEQSVKP